VLEKMGIPLARDDLVLLSGFLISNTAFVISALVLYRLSIWALRNEDTAYRAAILFCLTPANPFFFALYTESIFALASFCGMYAAFAASTHVPGPHRMFLKFLAALCFAGASYIRSNGIMLIGFFLYDAFLVTTQVIMDSRRSFWSKLSNFVAEAIQASLWSIIACAPFVNYLYSAYTSYCISETSRPWCSKVPPNIYSFVQEQYWNVGFLRYFRIHQLPNFLLAAPVIVISVSTCAKYLKSDWKRTFSLGVFETDKRASGLLSSRTFVFVAHLAALLITSVPIIHIQVLTRFLLSQCPVIYWFMAELLESRATWAPLKLAILTYCVAFSVIGVSLFSNFLPWT
jgi:phosphatidylinositol glycan class V